MVPQEDCVTIPSVPSVAMNANASGMPPKFAATPEKVDQAGGDPVRRAVANRRIRDEEPDEPAEQRRVQADLDARLVRVDVAGGGT